MSYRPQAFGTLVDGVEFDAASNIWTAWTNAGKLNQTLTQVDLQVQVGTTAILSVEYATSTLGSGFGTSTLNGGTTLTAGALYAFSFLARSSYFMNFSLSATVTVDQLCAAKKDVWS